MFRRCLVSVSDKTGLVEFLRPLAERGMSIYSTGGTAQHLKEHGLAVIDVSQLTGFPEVMDGRVKTLHPRVHMGLLARGDHAGDLELLKSEGLEPIDLLVCNLYPFEQALRNRVTERELVEKIDVGGPSMIRAAAKNYHRVTTICRAEDYAWILERSSLELEDRRKLAAKAFRHLSAYDSMVASALGADLQGFDWSVGGERSSSLRYGENPAQQATWFRRRGATWGLHQAKQLQGKELSYNNILDLDAASSTVRLFQEPCAVAVKHNNPCGVAQAPTIAAAIERAVAADPVSVFGGIVALNQPLDGDGAQVLNQIFLECIVAPQITAEAREILAGKKNLRLLEWPEIGQEHDRESLISIAGGLLVQTKDQVLKEWSKDWRVVGTEPSASEKADLLFAWKIVSQLKSNAIAIAKNQQSVGLGMGQVNRVDAVQQALERSQRFHDRAPGAVLASDAFFPFPDSIEIIASYGLKWVIQPGGSVKDEEVFRRAADLGVGLVLTGQRHFRH